METTETDLASEINSGFRQQMLEWRLQYAAWVALYGLLIAILFGLLGKGPLSKTELSVDDGGMQIRYERFLRRHTPDALRVDVLATGDTVEVRLGSQYLRHIRIDTITPQPERVIAAKDVLRQHQGMERISQIKYAVLETSGGISIVLMEPRGEEMLDRRIEAALDRRVSGGDADGADKRAG